MQRGMLWMWIVGLGLLMSCGADGPGFEEDETENSTSNESGTCEPEIDTLQFYAGSSNQGEFLRCVFNYQLYCKAKISSSVVRARVTDLDAYEADEEDFEVYYDLPVKGTYVDYDSDNRTLTVDFTNVDSTTTYEFEFRLVDSEGYVSETLSGEIVYAEADEVDE